MSGALVSVYLAVLLDCMGAYMVVPVLPFLAREMHGTPFAIGFMQALYCILQVFGTLVLGNIGDVVGRGKVLLVSLLFSTLSLLGFGLAQNLSQLLVFRGVNGFFAGTVSVCQAIVADLTSEEERPGKMALVMASYGLGVVIGPAVASLISKLCGAGDLGKLVLCLTAASLTMVNFVLGVCTLRRVGSPASAEARGDGRDGGSRAGSNSAAGRLMQCLLSDRLFSVLFSVTFLQNAAFGVFMGTAALVVEDLFNMHARQLGEIYCCAGVAMVIFQGFVTQRAVKLLGTNACIALGSMIRVACFVTIAVAASPRLRPLLTPVWHMVPWVVPVMVVGAEAFIDPCALSLVSEHAPTGSSGLVLGSFQSMGSLGAFVGPLVGGFLYGVHLSYPYWVAAASSMACIPVMSALTLRAPMKTELAEPLLEIKKNQEAQGLGRLQRVNSTQFALPAMALVESVAETREKYQRLAGRRRSQSDQTPTTRTPTSGFGLALQQRFTLDLDGGGGDRLQAGSWPQLAGHTLQQQTIRESSHSL